MKTQRGAISAGLLTLVSVCVVVAVLALIALGISGFFVVEQEDVSPRQAREAVPAVEISPTATRLPAPDRPQPTQATLIGEATAPQPAADARHSQPARRLHAATDETAPPDDGRRRAGIPPAAVSIGDQRLQLGRTELAYAGPAEDNKVRVRFQNQTGTGDRLQVELELDHLPGTPSWAINGGHRLQTPREDVSVENPNRLVTAQTIYIPHNVVFIARGLGREMGEVSFGGTWYAIDRATGNIADDPVKFGGTAISTINMPEQLPQE